MADSLLPVVKLFFPCEEAVYDHDRLGLVLAVPFQAVAPPSGVLPYEAPPFACYAMLTDAVGTFRFSVVVAYEDSDRVLFRSAGVALTFAPSGRIGAQDLAIVLTGVRFPRSGVYTLRLMCNELPLSGGEFALRVLGGHGP